MLRAAFAGGAPPLGGPRCGSRASFAALAAARRPGRLARRSNDRPVSTGRAAEAAPPGSRVRGAAPPDAPPDAGPAAGRLLAKIPPRSRDRAASALGERHAREPPPAFPSRAFDERMMEIALREANEAWDFGDIPVGAVLVGPDGAVLARAGNSVERACDPTAHAEMQVLRRGARASGDWRLPGTTLYVTLEPCPMCAAAALSARVGRVVYGARSKLLGADGSWIDLFGRGGADELLSREAGEGEGGGAGGEREAGGSGEGGEREVGGSGEGGERRADVSREEEAVASAGAGLADRRGQAEAAPTCGRRDPAGAPPPRTSRLDAFPPPAPVSKDVRTFNPIARSAAVATAGGDARGGGARAPAARRPRRAHPFSPDTEVSRGVLEDRCAAVLRDFFRARRRM